MKKELKSRFFFCCTFSLCRKRRYIKQYRGVRNVLLYCFQFKRSWTRVRNVSHTNIQRQHPAAAFVFTFGQNRQSGEELADVMWACLANTHSHTGGEGERVVGYKNIRRHDFQNKTHASFFPFFFCPRSQTHKHRQSCITKSFYFPLFLNSLKNPSLLSLRKYKHKYKIYLFLKDKQNFIYVWI